MKTKKQIAVELHDKLLAELVALEIKTRVFRLENKNKQKEVFMVERDIKQTEISILEDYIKLL